MIRNIYILVFLFLTIGWAVDCSDDDDDTCDDCSSGVYDPSNDGWDNDSDGWCNDGDQWPDCPNDPIDADPYDECGICNGDGSDMDCAGVCFGEALEDSCGVCDDNYNNDCIDILIDLHAGHNLISFTALPEDNSVESMLAGIDAILGPGYVSKYFDGWGWIGNITVVEQDKGYWLVTPYDFTLEMYDAIPISYDADGLVVYDIKFGANLISYPYFQQQYVGETLGDASANIYFILGGGGVCIQYDGAWIGTLMYFEAFHGYFIMATSEFQMTLVDPLRSGEASSNIIIDNNSNKKTDINDDPARDQVNTSSKSAAYYFTSVTLDGVPISIDDVVYAKNEESDVLVSSDIEFDDRDDFAAVFMIYGSQEEYGPFVDDTVGTTGYMQPDQIPQFYVNDTKAHYIANDGTILQDIPPFVDVGIATWVTLDLVSDCNGVMGGPAVVDPCGECDGENLCNGVWGCTDPLACNYDENATEDNGSCFYGDVSEDINADGAWNVLDVIILANCILVDNCAETLLNPCSGDMNNDGIQNVLDIVFIINCILNDSCN